MQLVEQGQNFDIDFEGFERLLSHLCQLLDISIAIKSPEGKTLIFGHHNAHGISCCMKEAVTGTCSAEGLHLFRRIESSGKKILLTNCGNIDIMGIPLKCNMELVGMLCACWKLGEGTKLHRAGALLEEIANRISYEIQMQFETESLTQELSDRYEELNLVYDIGKALSNITTSEEAIKFIAERSQMATGPDATVVSIPGRNILDIICSSPSGLPIDLHDKSLISKIDEIIMEKLSSHDSHPAHIVLDGASDNKLPVERLNCSLEILASPINLEASLAGILYITNFNKKNTFQTGNMRLLTSLAKQISMVITNSELYEKLKDVLLNVITSLVYSIEAKDSYTRGHSERVSTLVMMMAGAMNLSPEEKEALNWAAILHDIGKIGIQEKILNKAGKLNQEEFEHIKEHPEKGYMILEPIKQIHASFNAIRHHHERYDGTGYPSGLKGQKIPLYARMIAIADTYDAMTTRRPYKKKISHEDAIAEIRSVKGKQLDPELVEIFIALSEPISSL